MQQATEEATKEGKLVRLVRRVTGCVEFPNINSLARVAKQNTAVLGDLCGVVSVAYNTGQHGLPLEEGAYSHISSDVSNKELREFLEAIHDQGRTKSGRLPIYSS